MHWAAYLKVQASIELGLDRVVDYIDPSNLVDRIDCHEKIRVDF